MGKSKTVNLEGHQITWALARPVILARAEADPALSFLLIEKISHKPLADHDAVLPDRVYELKVSAVFVPRVNPDVMTLLEARLKHLINHPRPNHFVLISTGSHINGNKGLAEAQRQQCPEDVVSHCLKSNLTLSVILIDQDFFNLHQGGQIYDLAGGWLPHSQSLLGGHIRNFKHQVTGFTLSTYETHLTQWDGQLQQIGGVDLPTLGHSTNNAGGQLLVRMFNGNICYNSQPDLALGRY
ncbi:hypothetical protein HNQ50_001370 [Silvimonas terrae]|uniref:Uncharacterized protein n=1 Tax=Silvimonas terrae TaxID=300266 RepID=A0A840RDP3_9NEIS|nr:hypothetical protein [Silvimonas terrae]MBB5190648.1 hypothetical protein [Silvimonas terrae]